MRFVRLKLELDDHGTLIEVQKHRDGTIEACGVIRPITRRQERMARDYYRLVEREAIRNSTQT